MVSDGCDQMLHVAAGVLAAALMTRAVLAAAPPAAAPDESRFREQALEESVRPIRPGIPGTRPFWNAAAKRFIHAPAFPFEEVKGASAYRFTLQSGDKTLTFQAAEPWAPMSPVWRQVPVDTVRLTVDGLDAGGQAVGQAGTRAFYRAAVYGGPYVKPRRTYVESARMALAHLYRQPHVQAWKSTGKPAREYTLYCYPSKTVGAVIRGMTLYATLSPEHAADALAIAGKSADYLIGQSQPADAPLPFFPPTYAGTAHTAGQNQGQIMMANPASAALCYLTLHDTVKEERFLDAARRIADTYRKTQLPIGTWPLKVWAKSGEPIKGNLLIPTAVISLMERLQEQHGAEGYDECVEKAWRWIVENPLTDYYWEGQFEDVPLKSKYANLARQYPVSVALCVFERYRDDPKWVAEAEDLVHFAEDQFVVWERPWPQHRNVGTWFVPCALEQYAYYVPIDASVGSMILAFGKAYEVTGKPLYRAKAEGLANAMTVHQDPRTGWIPTYWWRGASRDIWINCLVADADVLLQFDGILRKKDGEKK